MKRIDILRFMHSQSEDVQEEITITPRDLAYIATMDAARKGSADVLRAAYQRFSDETAIYSQRLKAREDQAKVVYQQELQAARREYYDSIAPMSAALEAAISGIEDGTERAFEELLERWGPDE